MARHLIVLLATACVVGAGAAYGLVRAGGLVVDLVLDGWVSLILPESFFPPCPGDNGHLVTGRCRR